MHYAACPYWFVSHHKPLCVYRGFSPICAAMRDPILLKTTVVIQLSKVTSTLASQLLHGTCCGSCVVAANQLYNSCQV